MSPETACPKCAGNVSLQRRRLGLGMEYRCHNCTHVLTYREIITRHRRPLPDRAVVATLGPVIRVSRPAWALTG